MQRFIGVYLEASVLHLNERVKAEGKLNGRPHLAHFRGGQMCNKGAELHLLDGLHVIEIRRTIVEETICYRQNDFGWDATNR